MTWVAPGHSKERILCYGMTGSWKTAGAYKIAEKIAPNMMYVIDTDNSWPILSERVFPHVTNIDVADCSDEDWPECQAAVERAFELAGEDDWVVLDGVSILWDRITDYYTELITGSDLPKFLLEYRMKLSDEQAKKEGSAGFTKDLYNYINPAWNKAISRPIKSARCHVYMTAEAGDTGHPHEDRGTKQMYGEFGQKPRTQKGLGFAAATVLLLSRDKMGRGAYSTVKAWGREDGARNQTYEDFSKLLKEWGWRPAPPRRPTSED